YIANEARVNALTLAELASSPMPPAHVYFRGGQAIGTPVQWSPVEGAASYRVLLRPTFAPNWTIRIVAPPVPAPPPPTRAGAPPPDPNAPPSEKLYQITVPQSPDNYLFAVARTFGRGGRGRGAAPAGRGGAGGGGS